MKRRVTYILRDDSTGIPKYFSGPAHTLFTSHVFELRRTHALKYIDKRMAEIKADELRQDGHKISVEVF